MHRGSSLLVLAGFTLACSGSGPGGLPPGPRNPERNLALLESFADRTKREGLLAAWQSSFGERVEPKVFGRRPIRDLRPREIAALREALPAAGAQHRIDALEQASVRVRQHSDPRLFEALAELDRVRSTLRLDDPALHRVLLESGDEDERRRAWLELHAGTEELAPLVVEVTQARRAWALRAGRDSALEALAAVDGADDALVRRLRGELAAALEPRDGAALIDPWNDEAGAPAVARRIAELLPAAGLLEHGRAVSAWLGAEPTELSAGSGLFGYSASASFAIDPPEDVRVRITPAAGLAGAWRAFHELGHAAQARLAPPGARPLQQRVHSRAVSESTAKLAERLAWSPEWLATLGLNEKELAQVAEWEAGSERARGRRILADADFEEQLHARPDGALDAMHRASWAELGGLRSPHEVSAWAAQRSLSHAPGERMDYLLARCAQAAIYRRLRAQPGGLLGDAASRLLREEILPAAAGATYEDWFEAAAGEAPSCRAWIEDVARLGS